MESWDNGYWGVIERLKRNLRHCRETKIVMKIRAKEDIRQNFVGQEKHCFFFSQGQTQPRSFSLSLGKYGVFLV